MSESELSDRSGASLCLNLLFAVLLVAGGGGVSRALKDGEGALEPRDVAFPPALEDDDPSPALTAAAEAPDDCDAANVPAAFVFSNNRTATQARHHENGVPLCEKYMSRKGLMICTSRKTGIVNTPQEHQSLTPVFKLDPTYLWFVN